jgi:4-alpha-glucanotransferase
VRRETTDRTRVALLAAMGIDASTERAAAAALDAWRAEARERPAARVVERGATRVPDLGLPAAAGAATECEVEIVEESGRRHRLAARVRRSTGGLAAARLGRTLPLGYHDVRFVLRTARGHRLEGGHRLIVVPGQCPRPQEVLGPGRRYGLLAQLYGLRSRQNWGIGDLGDLRRLVRWAARRGAGFIGLNPIHALSGRGGDVSPYNPVSRLYRNTLYLDVTAVPEWQAVHRRFETSALAARRAAARRGGHVPYERVRALKRPAFEALHAAFVARHGSGRTARGRAYRRWLVAQGQALTDFATFSVLRERVGRRHGPDWRRWPAAYRDPRSPAVERFAAAHAREVDRECYLQFEVHRQLARAAHAGRAAGMALGLYQDLAIGSSPTGSDGWAFGGLFLDGASIGAPPDAWYALGQNWGFRPVDPRRLAASGYDYWIRLLRAGLAHAGALRIDHVMGLFRQFWIPAGRAASEGAYVRFPSQELLGVLALESTRAGTLVIGEDLGTVPPGLPRQLRKWSILSTTVLPFARTRTGAFLPARAYPREALVSANTHDMVPLAGYWRGRDLELRERSGQFASAAAVGEARRERERERTALVQHLRAAGTLTLTAAATDLPAPVLAAAVHEFLAKTPAVLLGISVDDLVGEVEPVNVPGTGPEHHPNWSRRLGVPIEALAGHRDVERALGGIPAGPRAALRRRRARAPRRSSTPSRARGRRRR